MPSLAIAFGFLTRVPIRLATWDEDDLSAALAWFPLVGLFVAAVGTTVRWGAGEVMPNGPAVVLAVLAMVAVTGALHEDGLADTFDGLWGGADRERRLEIMRDSRIGVYGTTAIIGVLLLRVTLLWDLEPTAFLAAAGLGHLLGRASTLVVVGRLDRVSGPSRAGAASAPLAVKAGPAIIAGGTVAVAGVVLTGWTAVVPVAAALAACIAWLPILRRRIGGYTGDTLGAVNQVVHVVAMAAVVAVEQAR